MPLADAALVFAGAAVIGLVHGAEPGHGWPVAAAYALNRQRTWLDGLAASLLVGLGHLVSSLAVVGAYFLAISYLDLARLDEPLSVAGLQVGSPVGIVAGVLLVALGVREYRHGHAHGHASSADHDRAHDDHEHHRTPDHDHTHGHSEHHDHTYDHVEDSHGHGHARTGGLWPRVKGYLPFAGGHSPASDWNADRQGLGGIVWTAFVLGFAHEEEFEIIALCTGSPGNCLALMVVYALAVVVALVGLTLALIAGYERYGERAERYADHLPTVSAVVLVGMGAGFALGLL